MTVESALLKQILSGGDFVTWNSLQQHYLPDGEYQKLWSLIDKRPQVSCAPTFEDLKYEVRSRELQENLCNRNCRNRCFCI